MSTTLKLTLAEYDAMIADGAFEAIRDKRIELIHGELIELTPPNPPHEFVVDKLNNWSVRSTSFDEVIIRVRNSVGIPELDSAPQPDIAWVRNDDYSRRRPLPSDVLLLIEVSDSSRRYDRGTKAELYASAGIQDYWIVDIPGQTVEVRREPRGTKYHSLQTFGYDESLTTLTEPSVELPVRMLFDVGS